MSYRPEDMAAWLEENPWDRGVPKDRIADTLGYQLWAIQRQASEIGGIEGAAVAVKAEGLQTHIRSMNERIISRYFES